MLNASVGWPGGQWGWHREQSVERVTMERGKRQEEISPLIMAVFGIMQS